MTNLRTEGEVIKGKRKSQNRVNWEPFLFVLHNKSTRLCKLMIIYFDGVKSVQCLATAEENSLALSFLGLTLPVLFFLYSSHSVNLLSQLVQQKPNMLQSKWLFHQISKMNLPHLKLWTHKGCHSREDRATALGSMSSEHTQCYQLSHKVQP